MLLQYMDAGCKGTTLSQLPPQAQLVVCRTYPTSTDLGWKTDWEHAWMKPPMDCSRMEA